MSVSRVDKFRSALQSLVNANPQANNKGDALKKWFLDELDEELAVSHVKELKQIGNRFKEQRDKNSKNNMFVCTEEKILSRAFEKIGEFLNSKHERIYFVLDDNSSGNGFKLEQILLKDLDDNPLIELVGTQFGTPTISSLTYNQATPSPKLSGISSYLDTEPNPKGVFPLTKSLQRILHGCPGSGKSYTLNQDAEDAHFVIRTVFHQDTRYADFIGGLRPESVYKLDEDETVTFFGATEVLPGEPYVQYVVYPGPMLKAYHLACSYPDKSVVLIVEELSRAQAANAFGDIIQLLDRDEDTASEKYNCSAYELEPRPEIRSWIVSKKVAHAEVSAGNIRFPPNLYIWATMNRADQNAKQLDSAFLRRWNKQYLSFRSAGEFDSILTLYGGTKVSWGELRSAINTKLLDIGGIAEDKLIGSYFLPQNSLSDGYIIYEDLWGYIWNDVLKNRASDFFNGIKSFAELSQVWDNGNGSPIGPLRGYPTDSASADERTEVE